MHHRLLATLLIIAVLVAPACVEIHPPEGSRCTSTADCPGVQTCQDLHCGYSCMDGVKNGTEADIDCGGERCLPCADGKACSTPEHCKNGVCARQVCQAPTCIDQVKNGDETAEDCGGPCPPCADGKPCLAGRDCQNRVCTTNLCRAATCTDDVKNGTEIDVDCGKGPCDPCADGKVCGAPEHCLSGVCTNQVCQLPSCSDTKKNGSETGPDCGGGQCDPCPAGKPCVAARDCQSRVCTNKVCQDPTCTDGVKNGAEIGVDCGSPCDRCADGTICTEHAHCLSWVCNGTCQAPSCNDSTQNGNETDRDCGGARNGVGCVGCAVGKACVVGDDCQTRVCKGLRCQAATCTDLTMNDVETDVDCGGGKCSACAVGRRCLLPRDCLTGVCTGSLCQPPRCDDEVKNGTETDKDCGGPCAPCAVGLKCEGDVDCQTQVCKNKVCQDATCTDNVKNGSETGPDCGGPCSGCAPGLPCLIARDCASQVCGQNGKCSAPSCGDGVVQPPEECELANLAGATCQTEHFSGGSLSCDSRTCSLVTSGCRTSECKAGNTRCTSGSNQQSCRDYNGDGSFEWGGDVSCPCLNSACYHPDTCQPFSVEIPTGTKATSITFWTSVFGMGTTTAVSSSGGTFDAPADACSATLDWKDRLVNFPTDPPQARALLTSPYAHSQDMCVLPVGTSWGTSFEGRCITPVCGNGTVEGGEACDVINLGGASCASKGFTAGALVCNNQCQHDTSQCCRSACNRGVTQCNGEVLQVCDDYNGDGCNEYVGKLRCGCSGGACSDSPCLAAVRAGQQACLEPSGRLLFNVAGLRYGVNNDPVSDAAISNGLFGVAVLFELGNPNLANSYYQYLPLTPLVPATPGVAVAVLPWTLPLGLCPQSQSGHRHPMRVSGPLLASTQAQLGINGNGVVWATNVSSDPGDFQSGLFAFLPYDTTGINRAWSIAVARFPRHAEWAPAAARAQADMTFPREYCTP